MGVPEFDRFSIGSLAGLLTEGTAMERYYALLPLRDQLIARLMAEGISDQYAFFKAYETSGAQLAARLGIGERELALFSRFLHLYEFKPRKLKDFLSTEGEWIARLIEGSVKTSGDYLHLCLSGGLDAVCDRFFVERKDAARLFGLCDLMRLPGVSGIRATLYYDSGYISLAAFSGQNAPEMRTRIARYIEAHSVPKSVPLKKELATQIAVADALPHLRPAQN